MLKRRTILTASKASFGSSHYRLMTSPCPSPVYPIISPGVQDNLRWENSSDLQTIIDEMNLEDQATRHQQATRLRHQNQFVEDTNTGRSSSPLKPRLLWPPVVSGGQMYMQNSPTVMVPTATSRRTTQLYQEHDLNGEPNPFFVTSRSTGSSSGQTPSSPSWTIFPLQYVFEVISHFELLLQIMRDLNVWSAHAKSSGASLALVSPTRRGTKLAWKLIVKIHGQNSSVVTKVNNYASSMNFEVQSTSHTCSDGSIRTHAVWKLNTEQGR